MKLNLYTHCNLQIPTLIIIQTDLYLKTIQEQPIDKQSNVFLSADIAGILEKIEANVRSISAPYSKHYAKYGGKFQSSSNGLERICEVIFDKNIDVLGICNKLVQNPNIEYAEPIPIVKLYEYKTNDPFIKPAMAFATHRYLQRMGSCER